MTILWLHISDLNRAVLHRFSVLTANVAIISEPLLFVCHHCPRTIDVVRPHTLSDAGLMS